MSSAHQVNIPNLASLPLADQIDMICDAFEDAWSSGAMPRIEEYLDCGDASIREQMLAELLLVDREFRVRCGEIISRHDYHQRFPTYSTIIDALDFATIDDRNGKHPPLSRSSSLVCAGGKLAQFELLGELGAGASGVVWKARDTRLRRLVAVKIPRHEHLSEFERERFRHEGRACAQLRHPNIVAVYEVGEDRGRAFIVTEFIDGMNLRDWLRQRRPGLAEAAELAAQLADALHHAHERGIIHRDLKPANVLMDRQGQPHVTDFGLAKWSAESAQFTVIGNILGTPAYMSPEQARGDAFQVDRRSDVYGLSALLYELLTGNAPFDGDVAAIVHHVIHDDPVRPRKVNWKIPRDLETICLKAIQKDPNRRYASAQEMAVDLRRFLRGDSIYARRTGLVEKSWRWLRHRPAAAALFVLVLVVAVAGTTIASLSRKNFELQGYRPVQISTAPAGARVAIIPIDERTGELNPDPAGFIRPGGVTPLTVLLRPGEYFIEAVLPQGENGLDFAEADFVVDKADRNSQSSLSKGFKIECTEDVCADMVAVPIDDELRRNNPMLPKILYVDANETAPDAGQQSKGEIPFYSIAQDTGRVTSSFKGAKHLKQHLSKRLPTAAEFEAILKSTEQSKILFTGSGKPARIDGLSNDLAEWTSTKYDFLGSGRHASGGSLLNMIVLKGYGGADTPPGLVRVDGQLLTSVDGASVNVGCRCVRSGAPRFVQP